MSRSRKIFWRVAISLCAILLLGIAWWIFLMRGLDRALSRPNLEASLEPLKITLKKAASDVLVVRRNKSTSSSVPPGGYLIAYEDDPEGFRADAKVFDT